FTFISFMTRVASFTILFSFFFMICSSPRSTLFPYTTLFRSLPGSGNDGLTMLISCWWNPSTRSVCSYVFGNSHEQTLRVDGFHQDRKSTRLNSSHVAISYAVFCLKKKKIKHIIIKKRPSGES